MSKCTISNRSFQRNRVWEASRSAGSPSATGDRLLLGIDQDTGILGKELSLLKNGTPGTDTAAQQDQSNPSPRVRHTVQAKTMLVGGRGPAQRHPSHIGFAEATSSLHAKRSQSA